MAVNALSAQTGTIGRNLWLAVPVTLGLASPVAAQDTGGVNVTFDVGQRLQYLDEDGFAEAVESEFQTVTSLGFGISSETRSQRLAFQANVDVTTVFDDGAETDADEQRAQLDYSRNTRATLLSFGTLYRSDRIDDLAFDTTVADEDIVTGQGQREVTTVNSTLVLGQDARATATFNHTYEASRFVDTLDAGLNDSDRQALSASLTLGVTRTLTWDIFADRTKVDEQGTGATDRDLSRIGSSISYSISPITTLTGEVSYSQEESRGDTVLQSDGVNFALSWARARPNGSISLNYRQDDALTGTRRQLSAGQNITLRRGSLTYALGVTETDGFDPQLLANLAYDIELDRNSALGMTLAQEGTINGDDQEVVNSRLNFTYSRELSRLSDISATFALVDEDILATGAADERALQFDLVHSYTLAESWDLTTSYQFSSVRIDDTPDRDRSTVSIGLRKSFSYRP